MTITQEIENCKKIIEFDREMLVHRIYEAWKKREEGEDTSEDRFILGLRWSEFLAKNSSNEEYYGAERRRNIYLGKIGVDSEYIRLTLEEIYGLH